MYTFPSSTSISSKPQSLWIPSRRCSPVANFSPLQPPRILRSGFGFNSVRVQHPTLSGNCKSPNSSLVSVITVAAWPTSRIRLWVVGMRRSTSGRNASRKPAVRACTSSTPSPLRDGYQIEDHDSLISGNRARNISAESGRGWMPVPGFAGEYHSDIPRWLMIAYRVCREIYAPCSMNIGRPSACAIGFEVWRHRSYQVHANYILDFKDRKLWSLTVRRRKYRSRSFFDGESFEIFSTLLCLCLLTSIKIFAIPSYVWILPPQMQPKVDL